MKLILDFYDINENLKSKPAEYAFPDIKTDQDKIEFFNWLLNATKQMLDLDPISFESLIEKENEFSFNLMSKGTVYRHIICKLEEG